MFGAAKPPQNEKTAFLPRSVYAISKTFAHYAVINYREAYNIKASNGILFNHESSRRGFNFVTKKIIQGLVRIKKGEQEVLTLGNLYARRDWGHAKDYVKAMWKILNHKKPDDYVISTSKSYSVKEFVNKTAKQLNIKIIWQGKGLEEVGINKKSKKIIIKINKEYFRETEVNSLIGNYNKAKKILSWTPKIQLDELIADMISQEK
jgi:GDPmannose 4,6-dehydratase